MATARTVAVGNCMDDNSVLSELTAETKKSMPLLSPMTPIENKKSEIDRARNAIRRASLSAAPPSILDASGHNHVTEDEEDYRMKYIPAHSSRRASISGPTVEIRRQGMVQEINPHQIHLYQEDDARSNHSRSSRKARRPSVKGSASNAVLLSVAGFTDDGDGYGTDNESVVSARSLQRRASLQQRRASLGLIEPPRTPVSSSSGSSTGCGVSELLAAASKPYLHQEHDDEEEEEVMVHHHHHHQPLYVPSSVTRGVPRSGSNDSREMMDMVKQLEPPQRVSRFARPKGPEPDPPRRGVQRHGTTDGLERNAQPSRRMEHDSPPQQPSHEYQQPLSKHETPQRGVQRFDTSDSVGMMNMRQGLAGSPTHTGAPAVPPHAQSRRGGRRSDTMVGDTPPHRPRNHHTADRIDAEGELQRELPIDTRSPLQRGVPRFATNDSVTMQVDESGENPRRGKRGEVQVMYATAPSGDDDVDDSDSSLSDPESEPESENDELESDSEYQERQPGMQQQQQPIPQRGVARYATNDSVTVKDMQAAGGRSPRRGKKPSALEVQIAKSDDNVDCSQSNTLPPQRGVPRFSTGDSVTMQSMRHDSSAKNPRRGGKRASVQDISQLSYDGGDADDNDIDGVDGDDGDNIEEEPQPSHVAPAQRGMPRFSTNDSVTMQSMEVDSSQLKSPRRKKRGVIQEPHQQPHPPQQRGVARLSTGDSVTMQSMRPSWNGSSARSPCRGGKRENVQGLEQLKESPEQAPSPQRGVARFSTGDSVTMQSMRHDPSARSPCRGGKRGGAQGLDQLTPSPKQEVPPQRGVARFSTGDSVTMQSMRHNLSTASPRRGGKRDTAQASEELSPMTSPQLPPQRGIARFATGDSVTMESMRHDADTSSPRRVGKQDTVQVAFPMGAANNDDSESSLSDPGSPQQPTSPQRGIARYSTNDSVIIQSMQKESGNDRSPRRGKRSTVQGLHTHEVEGDQLGNHHETPAPLDRGVARFSTNDSVTMQAVQLDTSRESPRRGRRSVNQDVSNEKVDPVVSNGDEEAFEEDEDVEIEYVYVVEEDEDDKDQEQGNSDGEERMGQTRQVVHDNAGLEANAGLKQNTSVDDEARNKALEAVDVGDVTEDIDEPNRGVFHTNTADSMDLRDAQQNGSAQARRGGRRQLEMAKEDLPKPSPQTFHIDSLPDDNSFADDDDDAEQDAPRTMTAENIDIRMFQQKETPQPPERCWEHQKEEDEHSRGQVHYVDYGYDGEGFDISTQEPGDDMLGMLKNAGSSARRGSTGVMVMEYTRTDSVESFRSNRRASTGQTYVEENPISVVRSSQDRMGRRNSTSSMLTSRSEFSHQAAYTPSVVSHQELRDMNHSYHGTGHGAGYGGNYFSKKQSRREDSDSEEDVDYGYGEKAAQIYGYGMASPPRRDDEVGRRKSELSLRSSSSSIRRGSARGSQRGKKLKHTAALMSGGKSRRRSSKVQHQQSDSEDSTIYGYGNTVQRGNGDGEDSMSESEMSMGSLNSRGSRQSTRSARRNSVVIIPDQAKDKMAGIGLLGEDDNKDETDLLNNSAYLEYAIQPPVPPNVMESHAGNEKRYGALGAIHKTCNEMPSPKPTHTLKSKDDSWGRSTPFTTPHSSLTKEALDMQFKSSGIPMEQPIHNISYHKRTGPDLDSSVDSSSDGGELYREKRVDDGYDEYNQRPRRRESIDKTCVDMGELLEKRNKKDTRIPKFTPAVNCTNASDYIVRAFVARLRHGLPVIKHNRSRWSKSQQRELILLPDGRHLSWKPVEGENDKGKRPKLDLLKCTEVRHAWSKDPDTRKRLGTQVLRTRCKDGSASKSFALIFSKRTLDMTAMSTDMCKVMMEGFSALCFRLQMEAMASPNGASHDDSHDDGISQCGDGARSVITDDDWASTIYESTTSCTRSNTISGTTVTNSPWGV